jgi:hypothetical protein
MPGQKRVTYGMPSSSLVVHLEVPLAAYDNRGVAARDVVILALGWDTPHWPSLAVGWLEQGLPVDAEIAALLRAVTLRGRWPQSLRHRAAALLRRNVAHGADAT